MKMYVAKNQITITIRTHLTESLNLRSTMGDGVDFVGGGAVALVGGGGGATGLIGVGASIVNKLENDKFYEFRKAGRR